MRRIVPAGDRALLIQFGEAINPQTLAEVLAFESAIRRNKPRGLIGTVASYASIECTYDPEVTSYTRLEAELQAVPRPTPARIARRIHEVPVQYDGPDLKRVSEHTGLSTTEVIAGHVGGDYLVYAVGFAPGFTYCGILPEALATPRLASPRLQVEPGSVGIAGRQTGIYAVASPGGWNIIGRTDLRLFDPARNPPARFKPGDRLRFVPV